MNNPTKSSWKIDVGHSSIQFKVKHIAIAYVSGSFHSFKGRVNTQRADFAGAQIDLEIEAASLSTTNNERDTHLKSDIFFDVEHFPTLTFSGILHKLTNDYELTGMLTIRGIAKGVTLTVDFMGIGNGRFGDTRAGFELSGRINRKDFDLTWNMLTEAGGLIVGEDIKLQMSIELIKD